MQNFSAVLTQVSNLIVVSLVPALVQATFNFLMIMIKSFWTKNTWFLAEFLLSGIRGTPMAPLTENIFAIFP